MATTILWIRFNSSLLHRNSPVLFTALQDNFDDNIPLLRSLWQTFDLNISESMVGETGFPSLYSLTLEDIGVGCLGVPQIF